MNGTQSPDQVAAMNADDFVLGEQISQDVKGRAVIGVIESGNKNKFVGDVEVGVACGQPLSLKYCGIREGKLNHLEFAPEQVSSGCQTLEVLLKRSIVGVTATGFNHGKHSIVGHKASNIVHVAVGVVAGD